MWPGPMAAWSRRSCVSSAPGGWFLEHGYVESGKAVAIRGVVNKLCRELRPQAVALVDGFGVPSAWLPGIARL